MTTDLSPVLSAVTTAVEWLDRHNGRAEQEIGVRVGKVAEELGEAWAAWIGATGQNPRKGVTHAREDVAGELADVAMSTLVALVSIDGDPNETDDEADDALTVAFHRMKQTAPPPPDRSDTQSWLLRVQRQAGRVADAHLEGSPGRTGTALITLLTVVFSTIEALGFDPAEVMLAKAAAIQARIGEQDGAQ